MKNELGVTLVELMIVIVIVAITLTIGVPGFQDMIAKNRSTSQAMSFISSLNLARSEAVKRGAIVKISASDGTDWENGWQVWVDLNADTNVDADELLNESAGLTGGNTLAEAGGATELDYLSSGRVANTVTFNLTSSSGDASHDRTIVILPTGRINVTGEI